MFRGGRIVKPSDGLIDPFFLGGHDQTAGGGSVESMHGPDPLADLVSKPLNQRLVVAWRELGSMNEEAAWFGNNEVAFGLCQNGEFSSRVIAV